MPVFDEETSDECFGALLSAKSSQGCEISKECAKTITTANLRSYALTHQILFSIEAEKSVSVFITSNHFAYSYEYKLFTGRYNFVVVHV